MDGIHGWFFEKRCELWNQIGHDGRSCEIIEVQRHNYRTIPAGRAVYYPESISGNPSSSVIFLGINPGQTELRPDENEQQTAAGVRKENQELDSCPNSIRNPNMDLEDYVQRHLHYNIQHPTEPIVAGAAGILQQTWACSNATALV